MEEVGGWIVGFFIVVAIVVWLIGMVLAAAYWILANVAFIVLACFDGLTSASLTSSAPAIMWTVWGALIGGALGFWTIAPVYGLRRFRPLIAAAPFILMIGFSAIKAMTSNRYSSDFGARHQAASTADQLPVQSASCAVAVISIPAQRTQALATDVSGDAGRAKLQRQHRSS